MARREDENENKQARVSRVKVAGFAVAAALALGVLLYGYHVVERFLIGDPQFALNGPAGFEDTPTLSVSGAKHASARAIETVFSDDAGRSVYLIPLEDRRISLRAVGWVKEASVARLWPNRVLVRIAEREPVAFLKQNSDFALIDEDGMILPSVQERFNLPVLAGIDAGAPLAQRREAVHRLKRVVEDLGVDAAAKLSEIDVADPENIEITSGEEGRVVTLLLGDRHFAARYSNFQKHHEDIRRRLPGATKFDLRLDDRITAVE